MVVGAEPADAAGRAARETEDAERVNRHNIQAVARVGRRVDMIASPTVDPQQTVPGNHRGLRRRPHSSVGMKFYLGVSAIAKRLVCGLTVSAQCHSIARFTNPSADSSVTPPRNKSVRCNPLPEPRQDRSRSRACARQSFLSPYPMQPDGPTGSPPLAAGRPSERLDRPHRILASKHFRSGRRSGRTRSGSLRPSVSRSDRRFPWLARDRVGGGRFRCRRIRFLCE